MKRTNVLARSAVFALMISTLTLFTLPGPVMGGAPPALGVVKEIRAGKLERQEGGTWKSVSSGDSIFAKDTVRTDISGVAILSLNRVGSFLIGPNTEYSIGENPKGFKTILHHGFVWFKSALAKGARMEISTDIAIAGVRGTKFSVLSDKDGVDVCTCKGLVEVSLASGKAMTVRSAMYSTVAKDGSAESPSKGKSLLEKLWKEGEKRHSTCRECHSKGKKPGDLL